MANDHVAIDGPVASGKTLSAKTLAAAIGHLYLDTGAMYRSVAYLALQNAVDLDNESGLLAMLAHHTIAIEAEPARPVGYRVLIDGRDVHDRLFDPDVAAAVSTVAALGGIRGELVERQRAIAAQGPWSWPGATSGPSSCPMRATSSSSPPRSRSGHAGAGPSSTSAGWSSRSTRCATRSPSATGSTRPAPSRRCASPPTR